MEKTASELRRELVYNIKNRFRIIGAEKNISSARFEFDEMYKKIYGGEPNPASFNNKLLKLENNDKFYLKFEEAIMMGEYLDLNIIEKLTEIAKLEFMERKNSL
jgi:hypothetical protein